MEFASLVPVTAATVEPMVVVPVPAVPGEGFADFFEAAMAEAAIPAAVDAVSIPPVQAAPALTVPVTAVPTPTVPALTAPILKAPTLTDQALPVPALPVPLAPVSAPTVPALAAPVSTVPLIDVNPPLPATDVAPTEPPAERPTVAPSPLAPFPTPCAPDVSQPIPLRSLPTPLGEEVREEATTEKPESPAHEADQSQTESPAAGFVPAGFVPIAVSAEPAAFTTPKKAEAAPAVAEIPVVVGTKAVTPPLPSLEAAPDLGIVPKVVVEAAASNVATALLPPPQPIQAPEPTAVLEAIEPSEVGFAEVLVDAAPTEKAPAGNDDSPPDDAPKDNVPQAAPLRTVATERPEAGADRPEVDRHLVVRQVADRIESLVASRPRDGVTIHLEPRDLGTVTLVVKGLASALDVQVFASDERVREGLEASRPELAQALAPRQIEIRELRVWTSPTSSTASDPNANPDGRPRHQAAPQQPAFSGKSVKTTAAVRTPRSGRGVDLLV